MARVITKIGDIFSAKLDDNSKKYLQYIANDLTQLNSDVIRVFKKVYPVDANPDLSEVVKDEVDFYAHCVVNWGIKMGLWKKVGKFADIGRLEIIFRSTDDSGLKPGEEPVRISHKWYVWKVNDKRSCVGKLVGENKKSEIGVVVTPGDIIDRMKTGKYDFVYPGYEGET